MLDFGHTLRRLEEQTRVLTSKVNMSDSKNYFSCFCVCFQGAKQGWKEGCKMISGVNGSLFKTTCIDSTPDYKT